MNSNNNSALGNTVNTAAPSTSVRRRTKP